MKSIKRLSQILSISITMHLCFSGNFTYTLGQDNNSPKWNITPNTRIDFNPVGYYSELPQTEAVTPTNNAPTIISTPEGDIVVNPSFRVLPSANTQSETPITRSALNPYIMVGSANNFNVGGPTTASTGNFVTINGGTAWNGFNVLGNNIWNYGDPGPTFNDFWNRFIISFINSTGQMAASYISSNPYLSPASAPVIFPGSTGSSDKNFSATSEIPGGICYGNSYTVYTEFGGTYINRIVFSKTVDGGSSWSTITPVSPVPITGHHEQGCDIVVGPNGTIYVCWANCITNGQNSTEDSLGFAKSTDCGSSWNATNSAVDMNGVRAYPFFNGIRANGFPRIDVDKTCGKRRGYIYIVTAEKNFAPAIGVSDIVLMRSVNEGLTWTRVKVNQNTDPTKYDYCPAVRVDESGAVNVCYYSTRNSPGNNTAEVFLSRSEDGGLTFTDINVTGHAPFSPAPISGLAAGYQGDYIGITSALIGGNPINGNQRVWPYWCDNSTGVYQAWTAKVEFLPKSPCLNCQGFDTLVLTPPIVPAIDPPFTPDNYFTEYASPPSQPFWSRGIPNRYAKPLNKTGSAKYDFYNDNYGPQQSLVTRFEPLTSLPSYLGWYLTFDNSYACYPGFGPDYLHVDYSSTDGSPYTTKTLIGNSAGTGSLNTSASATFAPFSPTVRNHWRRKMYLLPAGTNKVRFRTESGFGNNLYIDSICISVQFRHRLLSLKVVPEGMYRTGYPKISMNDTVHIYFYPTDYPDIAVDSATAVLNDSAVATFEMESTLDGTYYIAVKHRNSIETWSRPGGEVYIRGQELNYNFISPSGQAYGNNQQLVSLGEYAMYSGDVNQDDAIDGVDLSIIDNDAFNFVVGYVVTDLTGDGIVDASDAVIADNNASNFVVKVAPPGAGPAPAPIIESNNNNLHFENDFERNKYELSKNKRSN